MTGPPPTGPAAAAPTPAEFTGVWRRRSLSIDGAPPHEPADVWWLQVGDHFADLRQPHSPASAPLLSGPGAFAGHTTWDDPVLTWHHRLDSACLTPGTPPPQDQGRLERQGDLVVETGTADLGRGPVTYVEVWERLPSPPDHEPAAFAAGDTWCRIEVDGHRLSLIVDPATARWAAALHCRGPTGWSPRTTLGHPPLLATLPDAPIEHKEPTSP